MQVEMIFHVQAYVYIRSASSLEAICVRNQDHRMEGAWKPESPLKGVTIVSLQLSSHYDVIKK